MFHIFDSSVSEIVTLIKLSSPSYVSSGMPLVFILFFIGENTRSNRIFTVQECLESKAIHRMNWSAGFLALNPFEYMWANLGRRLMTRSYPLANTKQLKQMFFDKWILPRELLYDLMLNFNRRYNATVADCCVTPLLARQCFVLMSFCQTFSTSLYMFYSSFVTIFLSCFQYYSNLWRWKGRRMFPSISVNYSTTLCLCSMDFMSSISILQNYAQTEKSYLHTSVYRNTINCQHICVEFQLVVPFYLIITISDGARYSFP